MKRILSAVTLALILAPSTASAGDAKRTVTSTPNQPAGVVAAGPSDTVEVPHVETEAFEEMTTVSRLEARALSAQTLDDPKFDSEILAPFSGALAALQADHGRSLDGGKLRRKALSGAELLAIPSVREKFEKTAMFGLSSYHDDPSVRSYIDFFDGRGKRILTKWIARMGRFEDLIRSSMREEGLPEDLIYVAMIESGYSPRATSPAAAAGVWQFIPTTGSAMGLRIDDYVDERRDPVKATMAACRYLKYLHTKFGSWPLALAAYNGGPGLVAQTILKYNSNDYFFIQRHQGLYDETRRYVPKIIAAGLVTKNAAVFGLDGIKKVDEFDFEVVEVPGSARLSLFASATGASVKRLRTLNPELRRNQTPPGGLYSLRIPAKSLERFTTSYDKLALKAGESHTSHVVRFGETLKMVGATYGVAPRVIRVANGLGRRDRVSYGTELIVPTRAKGTWKPKEAAKRRVLASKATLRPSGAERFFYSVKRGDTLDELARAAGLNAADLAIWNDLDTGAKLQKGLVLQVFPRDAAQAQAKVALLAESQVQVVKPGSKAHKTMIAKRKKKRSRKHHHKVKRGESLWTIARKYKVTVKDLKRWNRKVKRNNTLQPGQKIVVQRGGKRR